MAPASRKRKSEALEEATQPATPTASPARKKLKITESQKQALIDNLQLEITERARHLRAHYALQCADLRSRIERRINRLPIPMRKMTMRELMAKHAEVQKPKTTVHAQVTVPAAQERPLPALPQDIQKPLSPVRPHITAPAPRGRKRKSSEIHIASDKEDTAQAVPENLPVKKPRGKAAANTTATRTASRSQKPPSVLSPRSHNSRTLPRSPIKEWNGNSPIKSSPTKSMIARPISPLKPASPLKSAATAATSALSAAAHGVARGAVVTAGKLSRQASREKANAEVKGRMLPPLRPLSDTALSSAQRVPSSQTTTSETSTTSTSTTVVKPKRGRPGKAPVEKKSPVVKPNLAAKTKTALNGNAAGANKKVVVAEPAAGRRVLRKRN